MRYLIIFCFVTFPLLFIGQDSIKIFSYSDFISVVKKHHPLTFKAELKQQEGDWYIAKSKGGFDPKLKGSINQKYFDNKQYYSYINGGLVVPTWFGISASAGYNNNEGVFLNPESYTKPEGVWNAGVSVNLGKGLFIDQRRADLKQAKYIKSTTLLEQNLILNQLNYDAITAYIDWFKAYNKMLVYNNSVLNAEIRLNSVKTSVLNGDKPAVDTLKAHIQLQDRKLKLAQSKVLMLNKKAWLNTFLWQDGFIPLELDSLVSPKISDELEMRELKGLDNLVENHPEIVMYKNDIEINKIDYRLKKESLKPTVQLKYNALSSNSTYNIEDYNWGAKVAYPIFSRKERANVKLSGLKVEQKQMNLFSKKATIKYKLEASYNQALSMNNQIVLQQNATDMYEELYKAEKTLFDIGESSLFLVNIREQNLIESEIKLIDIRYEQQLSYAVYNYHLVNF